ncbi:hypothetical protein V8C42DRAFT_319219 [Trichoderma barbatum]
MVPSWRHNGGLRQAVFRIALPWCTRRSSDLVVPMTAGHGAGMLLVHGSMSPFTAGRTTNLLLPTSSTLRKRPQQHFFEQKDELPNSSLGVTLSAATLTTNHTFMAKRHQVQRPSLASLVFLAGAASGTLLTLSNFQSLTSSVSVQCLYAYNLPIRGCTPRDFIGDATCSESCIAGLQAVQFTVRGLCSNVNSADNSLLKQVKEGHILDALCKADTPQMSSTAAPTPPPTQTPPPQESSEPSEPSEPESTASDPISTTSSAPPEATTSAIPTLTSVVIPSSTSESTIETTSAPTSQATNDEQPSTSSEEKPQPTRKPNRQPGRGGGDPFDFVATSKATKFGLFGGTIYVATTVAFAFTTLTLI